MKIYDKTGNLIIDIAVDDNSYHYREIMGAHYVTLYFSLAEHVSIPTYAYIDVNGIRYTLLDPESVKLNHTHSYDYTISFDAPEGIMALYKFRNPTDGALVFTLTAKPKVHLQMLVDNLNMRDTGWAVGECDSDIEISVSYNHTSCLDALKQQSQLADTEYEVVNKVVSLRRVEYNKYDAVAMEYGRDKGFLPGVSRTNYGAERALAAVYAQGGERNINYSDYGSQRLLLPKGQSIRYDGTHFEGEPQFVESRATAYTSDASGYAVRRAESNYNIAEGSLDCTEIYPHRESKITGVYEVDAENSYWDIEDNTIPDNLNYNDYRIEGSVMTIIFQSGNLIGREFEVSSYNHDKRRFQLVPIIADGLTMPSGAFIPSTGDEYAVFGISLPNEYICDNDSKTGASWDMMRKCVKHLYIKEKPSYSLSGEVDALWCKRHISDLQGKIIVGGYINFTASFQTEPLAMRILAIKTPINKPYSPELTISESVVVGTRTLLHNVQAKQALQVSKLDNVDARIRYTTIQTKQALESVGTFEGRVSTLEGEIKNVETIATNAGTIAAKEAVENDPTIQKASADAQEALETAESASQKVDTQASQNITMQQTITQHTAQIAELETGVLEANETAEDAKAQAASAQSKATTAQSAAEASATIADEAKAIAESAVQPDEITADMVNRYADNSNNGGLTTSWQTAVPLIPALRANRLAFLPYDDFYVEEAKDGVTFTRVATTNEMLDMWCNGIGGYPLYPDKGWDVGSKVRITIAPQQDMYAFIDILAIYIYGNGRTFDIEAEACSKPAEGAEPQWVHINSASTTSAQTETYAMMTYRKFVGFPAYANGWGMRLTFTITKNLNSQSIISGIYGFSDRNSFLRISKDTAPQTLGSLYTWDRYKNVTFPGIIQAKIGTFTGNLSTSGAFSATGSISGYGLTLTSGTEDAVLQGNGAPIGKDMLLKNVMPKPATQPYSNNLMVWDADNETVKDSGYSVATSVQSLEWMEPEEVPTCEQVSRYISDAIPTEVATATQIGEYSLDDLVQGNYVVRIHPNVLTDVARGNSIMDRLICAVSGVSNQYDNVWRVRVYTNSPIIFVDAASDNALSIMWDNGVAPVYEGDVACVWDIRLRQYGELWLGEYKQYKE